MLELFYDSLGIVHLEFFPDGITLNKTCYKQFLLRLRDSIGVGKIGCCYTIMPLHIALCLFKTTFKAIGPVLPHNPYSPDLAPYDFFLFPRLEAKLRGRRCHYAKEVMTATREAVWDLPAYIFERCIQQLYQSWQSI